jgi:hypothetical protein
MKIVSHFTWQLAVCLLLSCSFMMPMNARSQSPVSAYALESSNPGHTTDVIAYVVHDSKNEKYTLSVVNPSQKKLKIYFYAGGIKYAYRASSRKFSKPFDLTGADDGVYAFVIQDGKARLKTEVQINTLYVTKKEIKFLSRSKVPNTSLTGIDL